MIFLVRCHENEKMSWYFYREDLPTAFLESNIQWSVHIIAFLTNIIPAYFGISHHGVSLLHWHHVCVIISSFFPFRGVVVPFHLEAAWSKISILFDFSNLCHCCCIFVRPSREVLKNRFSLMEEQRLKIDLVLLQTVLQRGLKKRVPVLLKRGF